MSDPAEKTDTSTSQERPRPLTYHQASSSDSDLVASRERYEELTSRDMSARTAAMLRERGEFDHGKLGHRLVAEAQPLTAEERLELMAHGEVLARYYRHPTMLDHAAQAGCSWEQIGAARGTSAEQAREDYREWAESQHDMHAGTGVWSGAGPQPFGLTDEEYGVALARLGDPESCEHETGGRILCAHADQNGRGSHWLEPGERCPLAPAPERDREAGQ